MDGLTPRGWLVGPGLASAEAWARSIGACRANRVRAPASAPRRSKLGRLPRPLQRTAARIGRGEGRGSEIIAHFAQACSRRSLSRSSRSDRLPCPFDAWPFTPVARIAAACTLPDAWGGDCSARLHDFSLRCNVRTAMPNDFAARERLLPHSLRALTIAARSKT
jgi:hypothetical protein